MRSWLALSAVGFLACGGSGGSADVVDAVGALDAADASDTAGVPDALPDVAGDADRDAPREIELPPLPDLARFVDPLIGTRGPGNVIPGPCVPHGMVKLSPDTNAGAGSIDAYEWGNDRIEGFSHTHLEGPGGSNNGYSHVMLLPQTGPLKWKAAEYPSKFRHDDEVAEAGYYAVTLDDYGVRAELTATARAGVHRYTFPEGQAGRVILDLGHSRGVTEDGDLAVVGQDVVEGFGVWQVNPLIAAAVADTSVGSTGIAKVYFHARFSRPFQGFGTWDPASGAVPDRREATGGAIGAWVEWPASDDATVEVRVGISYLGVEQAKANLERETTGKTFDDVRADAARAWNRLLWRVEVEGGTDAQRTVFYTGLYHSLLQPADYTEDGRFWIGNDGSGKVRDAGRYRYFTDNWCLWDTVHTTHPLLTILEPEVVGDMVQSLVWSYEEGGWMQKCTWNATGDGRVMTANSQFCVVADAYVKGLRDFDAEKAFEGMKKGSLEDSENVLQDVMCGYLNQGTPPDYVQNGYVPRECDPDQAASMTLEYAWHDWCVGTMARAMGKDADADFFLARSGNWKNTFNPAHGFAQQRLRNGEWVEPFDPGAFGAGFTEANSWQYSWFVPHDLCGLAEGMGGTAAFLEKLDRFFDEKWFTPDNEPDFHAPWLYDVMGDTGRTADRVRGVVDGSFGTDPGSLPGNDDAGATSAWLVFAALGLYPVTPGDGWYWLNPPLFPKATVHVDPERREGVDFVIEARDLSEANRHIVSATLDGVALEIPRVAHADVVKGGTLVLQMGPAPGTWKNSCQAP